MLLLIWFKAGIQTSPPIVPLDRETQAQPLGKLLLSQEWSGVWGCSEALQHISCQLSTPIYLFYKKEEGKVWRK